MVENKYTPETIRLRANELMLNSKGFILFVVNPDGSLQLVGDETELSGAERKGLHAYRKENI